MSRLGTALCCVLFIFAGETWLVPRLIAQAPKRATSTIDLPAGTKIELALIRPLMANTTGLGTPIYAQTTFPVVIGNGVAIPPGTYTQGTLTKLVRPTRRSNRAELRVLFTQIIFANGYIAPLAGISAETSAAAAPETGAAAQAEPDSAAQTLIAVSVQVSASSDVLLDNGAQIEATLGAPLQLDARQVAAAVPLSHAPVPGLFKSASRCTPIPGSPGTPGTPDIVIPGSPGTPSTVIPGGPGMPDTVIPGTPATPPTVIHGTPGTPDFPGRSCPGPPIVLSSTLVTTPNNPSQVPSPVAQ